MEHSLHSSAPTVMIRPHGAHRFEAFSPKLSRRPTIYRRVVCDARMLIKFDPSVVTFGERPGTVLIGERYHQVDFSVRYAAKAELLIAADSLGHVRVNVRDTIDTSALPVRFIPHVELVAARMWIDNWHRMLPSIVATRGLISRFLITGIERFANKPQQLATIEGEFSMGDPTVVRAATFRLLHEGRLSAPDLHVESLSLECLRFSSMLTGEPSKALSSSMGLTAASFIDGLNERLLNMTTGELMVSKHRQCCSSFRYCRLCSGFGYHSVLFQRRPSESIFSGS